MPKHVVSLLEYNIFLNKLCCSITISSLSLVTHTTGMTQLKAETNLTLELPTMESTKTAVQDGNFPDVMRRGTTSFLRVVSNFLPDYTASQFPRR